MGADYSRHRDFLQTPKAFSIQRLVSIVWLYLID